MTHYLLRSFHVRFVFSAQILEENETKLLGRFARWKMNQNKYKTLRNAITKSLESETDSHFTPVSNSVEV